MEAALYAPGLGYYAAGASKFGAEGDFVTAPEISPLFGQTLAMQIAQVLAQTGGEVLELGAGTGRLAAQVLDRLAALDRSPARYLILEPSADLQQRQRAMLARHGPQVQWLDRLPDGFTGAIVGNEVLDAVPVDIVVRHHDQFMLRGVSLDADSASLRWQDRPLASGPLLTAAQARYPQCANLVSEINLASEALVRSLGAMLSRGLLLFLDYGYPAAEYYHAQRDRGTLMCHYRQHAHDDPFYLPGLQDITAHVDFSAIAEAGIDAGLDLAGYTSQAQFLMNAGILELLAATPPEDAAAYLPLSNAVQRLLSPAEMGELVKAIAFTRGVEEDLAGFARGDRRHRL
jgi:SAM-dependent MidA family methyltransferase